MRPKSPEPRRLITVEPTRTADSHHQAGRCRIVVTSLGNVWATPPARMDWVLHLSEQDRTQQDMHAACMPPA